MTKKKLTLEQMEKIQGDMSDLDVNLNDAVGLDTEPEKTMYCPPDDADMDRLYKKGYRWDNDGLYCPIDAETDEPHYLRIKRGYDAYDITIGLLQDIDGKILFDVKTGNWTGKTPITTDHKPRNQQMGKVVGVYGKIPDIADPLRIISADLNGVKNFPQITEHFKVYQEMDTGDGDDPDGDNEYAQELESRRKPILTPDEQDTAQYVSSMIKEYGLTGYLDPILNHIHIGDHRNIYRKILMSLQIIRGDFSAFLLDIAQSGSGKSHENKIVFETIIPERYTEQIDNITEASFIRFSDNDTYYLDRKIILFNDKGDSDGITNMKDVNKILKALITENSYSDYKSDAQGNKWVNKKFYLKVQGVGAVLSTVDNKDALNDSQIVNRSLQSRPSDVDIDELLDHIGYLKFDKSIQSMNKKGAEADLKDFGIYLMSLVTDTDIIVNPYIKIFQRYCKTANVLGDVTREYERQLYLFDAYCRINKHLCKKQGNYYIASQTLVNSYFSDINPENALNPIESDFIEMLMKGNGKTEPLILIDDGDSDPDNADADSDDPDDLIYIDAGTSDPYSHYIDSDGNLDLTDSDGNDRTLAIKLIQCLNAVVEHFIDTDKTGLDRYGDDDITYDILNRQDTEQCNKQLLQWYKVRGGVNNKFPVFFRVNDIKTVYRNYKSFKNVKDVSVMMEKMVYKGYANKMGKLDGYNIYYLTTQCRNLKKQELKPDDLIDAGNFLKETGFYDLKDQVDGDGDG